MSIRVVVNGANGKMGQVSIAAIDAATDLELVAKTNKGDDLAQVIGDIRADVVVDFTEPACVYHNTLLIIDAGACPVIGTTGLSWDEINQLQARAKMKDVGGVIAPNFSISAILMMRYARDASRYLPDVEIIETHHPQKKDAPSGTAKKTAEMIASVRPCDVSDEVHCYHGVPIHSVRLTGCFAHQAVVFGNQGETLTIRHDAMSRESMMPGLISACRAVVSLDELYYGLESILELSKDVALPHA